jgi:hypothetical protein
MHTRSDADPDTAAAATAAITAAVAAAPPQRHNMPPVLGNDCALSEGQGPAGQQYWNYISYQHKFNQAAAAFWLQQRKQNLNRQDRPGSNARNGRL